MTIRELGLHLLNPRVKTCEGCTATEVHLSSLIAAAMPWSRCRCRCVVYCVCVCVIMCVCVQTLLVVAEFQLRKYKVHVNQVSFDPHSLSVLRKTKWSRIAVVPRWNCAHFLSPRRGWRWQWLCFHYLPVCVSVTVTGYLSKSCGQFLKISGDVGCVTDRWSDFGGFWWSPSYSAH